MSFFIIRTFPITGLRVLVGGGKSDAEKAFQTYDDAYARACEIPGSVKVREFNSPAEARMYCDPSCVAFRNEYDSAMAAKVAGV